MRKVFGKLSIADPSGFKSKLRAMKKKERAERLLKRSDTKSSMWSETIISKS